MEFADKKCLTSIALLMLSFSLEERIIHKSQTWYKGSKSNPESEEQIRSKYSKAAKNVFKLRSNFLQCDFIVLTKSCLILLYAFSLR